MRAMQHRSVVVHGSKRRVVVDECRRCKRWLWYRWMGERVIGMEGLRVQTIAKARRANVHHGGCGGSMVQGRVGGGHRQRCIEAHAQTHCWGVQVAGLRVEDGVVLSRCLWVVANTIVGESREGEGSRVQKRWGKSPRLIARGTWRGILVGEDGVCDCLGSGVMLVEDWGDGRVRWLAHFSWPVAAGGRTTLSASTADDTGSWLGPVVGETATSGNCCRKLARKSSPGFWELVLHRGRRIVSTVSSRRWQESVSGTNGTIPYR